MKEPLTDGAIVTMSNNPQEGFNPVLQIVDLKMVSTCQSAVERYRLVLSDGTYLQQGMIATQKNHMVAERRVKKGTVVRLTHLVVNNIQNRLLSAVGKNYNNSAAIYKGVEFLLSEQLENGGWGESQRS